MTAEPLPLPAPAAESRPPRTPLLAALVPVVAGIVLWQVTGSLFSLCFAAIGPLMLIASLLDGIRVRRKERRTESVRLEREWGEAEAERERRHRDERMLLRLRHPDVLDCLREAPLAQPDPSADTMLVIGSGERPSALRTSGGGDDSRSRELRGRCSTLTDAPLTVPLGGGVLVRGAAPVADAVIRALALQLALRSAPSQLRLQGQQLGRIGGLEALPHAVPSAGTGFAVSVGPGAGQARLVAAAPDAEVPAGITTVIDVTDPGQARVRTGDGVHQVALECVSAAQAAGIAADLAARLPRSASLPGRVLLGEVPEVGDGELAAVIGADGEGPVSVDLVGDGPHALLTGITGSGKSELLISWIVGMARRRSPQEVTFVLADFKGGTAFEPLRRLPHVTAVITDLDQDGSRRGVQSLIAELRRREGVLAAAGARDITDARGALPRLVIVVDEFAALVNEHPDLAAVFTDVAARGRALGMHLIIGTQRATGVIRDALAANCPLRLSLRSADAADSRLVIGSDAAAALSGGGHSRGIAFVRRPQDDTAMSFRAALTQPDDIERIASEHSAVGVPQAVWLPPLPEMLPLSDLPAEPFSADGSPPALVLGLADEPDAQRQPLVSLRPGQDRGIAVVGGGGSGRTALLRLLAAQDPAAMVIGADPERAWDAVSELGAGRTPTLLLVDDLDRLVATMSTEHATTMLERLELSIRSTPGMTAVVTAGRLSGGVGRVMDALPRRIILRLPTAVEHIAAGGEHSTHRAERPAGRALLHGREMQVAWPGDGSLPVTAAATDLWAPSATDVGVVASGVRRTVSQLRAALPGCDVREIGAPASADIEVTPGRPAVLVGDGVLWQREWALWQRIRSGGEMLVLAECAADLRALTGLREPAPYASPHAGRAWSIIGGESPRRVRLPAGADATVGVS